MSKYQSSINASAPSSTAAERAASQTTRQRCQSSRGLEMATRSGAPPSSSLFLFIRYPAFWHRISSRMDLSGMGLRSGPGRLRGTLCLLPGAYSGSCATALTLIQVNED